MTRRGLLATLGGASAVATAGWGLGDEDENGDVIPVEKEVCDGRGPLTLIVAH